MSTIQRHAEALSMTMRPPIRSMVAKTLSNDNFKNRNPVQVIDENAALVAIHDSARPLITAEDTRQCILDANEVAC